MKCPCEECLKYPICINEEAVQYSALHAYAVSISTKYNRHNDPVNKLSTERYWNHLKTIIPNIGRLYKDDNPLEPI